MSDQSRVVTYDIPGDLEWREVAREEIGKRFLCRTRITYGPVGLRHGAGLPPPKPFSDFLAELERRDTAVLAERNLPVPGEGLPASLVKDHIERALGYAPDSAEGLAARILVEIERIRPEIERMGPEIERALDAAFELGRLVQLSHVSAVAAGEGRDGGREAARRRTPAEEAKRAEILREFKAIKDSNSRLTDTAALKRLADRRKAAGRKPYSPRSLWKYVRRRPL